jgi:dihydrofolate reductase
MTLSLIVAIDEAGAMGIENRLPWHLPADLAFFKKNTLGKPVVMGRKTWESLGRKLPGRLNIVLSSQQLALPEGVVLAHNWDDAQKLLALEATTEAFVIGGSGLFAEVLPILDKMYITRVHTKVEKADTFFPTINFNVWQLVWEQDNQPDEKNRFAYTFQIWERN